MPTVARPKTRIDASLFSNWIAISSWWGSGLYHLIFDRSVFVSLLAGIMYFTVSGAILCALIGAVCNRIERLFTRAIQPMRRIEPNWFTVAALTIGWLTIFVGEVVGTVWIAKEYLQRW